MTKTYYSHGKLLLTAEYLVLDGAKALAVPTKKGQRLEVTQTETNSLEWLSILEDGSQWIAHTFTLPIDQHIQEVDPVIATLHKILIAAHRLNPHFLSGITSYKVRATLEFSRDWGLGSSSTLITNIAQWAAVNPYTLLAQTFGGSGYDIACAQAATAVVFKKGKTAPIATPVAYTPLFGDYLFFVHLNKKQNSRESIKQYRSLVPTRRAQEVEVFSQFTEQILAATALDQFESVLSEHENRLSSLLKTPTIKEILFSEYPGTIKSLGGWGGDFILATGTKEDMTYFKEKQYPTIIPYRDMVL